MTWNTWTAINFKHILIGADKIAKVTFSLHFEGQGWNTGFLRVSALFIKQNLSCTFSCLLSLFQELVDLSKEIAFNLALIYRTSGSDDLAAKIYHKYLRFWGPVTIPYTEQCIGWSHTLQEPGDPCRTQKQRTGDQTGGPKPDQW